MTNQHQTQEVDLQAPKHIAKVHWAKIHVEAEIASLESESSSSEVESYIPVAKASNKTKTKKSEPLNHTRDSNINPVGSNKPTMGTTKGNDWASNTITKAADEAYARAKSWAATDEDYRERTSP